MKKAFFFTVLLAIITFSYAQNNISQIKAAGILDQYVWSHTHYKTGNNDKPVLDFNAIDNWIGIGPNEDLSLSPNGKYFAYSIRRTSAHQSSRDSLIIQSVNGYWRKSFPGTSVPGFFTSDNRQYIFLLNDELHFSQVGGSVDHTVKGIESYRVAQGSNNKWLAYQLKNSHANLVLLNTLSQKETRFTEVARYAFDKNGMWLVCTMKNEIKELLLYNIETGNGLRFAEVADYKWDEKSRTLILKTEGKVSDGFIKSLQIVNLINGNKKIIWSTKNKDVNIVNYSLDASGEQVVFMVQEQGKNNSIWYYRVGMDNAIKKADNHTEGIEEGLYIQGSPKFTNNGKYILFSLQPPLDTRVPDSDAVQVEVWSYKDTLLQSIQSHLKKEPRTFAAVIEVESEKVIRLEHDYERLKTWKIPGNFVVVGKISSLISGDKFWEENYDKDSNWLVSLTDGTRKLLSLKVSNRWSPDMITFTPSGKYLIYFNPDQGYNYFAYNLETGKTTNISKGVPPGSLCFENFFRVPKGQKVNKRNYGIAAWFPEDEGLLIYDSYDIWQLDLKGNKAPTNITGGVGRRQHILFSLINHDRLSGGQIPILKSSTDTLLLNAFNRKNKYNGFYQKILGMSKGIDSLYMGPYFFQTSSMLPDQGALDLGMQPIKAADSDLWIVKRQSAIEAPNYFATNDFRTYSRLTNIQPQKKYNWLTAELHTFKQKDGIISQGILYKPENFDSTKKYPTIISFYLQKSDQLNQYPTPEYLICPEIYSNPAWFVSHGYIVFIPDIYFNTIEGWGPSTLNTMDGAANYLSKRSYIDGKHLGAAGHSNSGRFGYYLLTHSNSFAAMCIGAGTTDIIGTALSVSTSIDPGESRLQWAEIGAPGTGLGELWKNKQKWMDHNPVLQADKIISPLLMIHNKGDAVLFSQPVELFTAMRRLKKKVWWLQYDQGGHRVELDRDKKDLTIRYTQYFDHFLKGAPAPWWMTKGIPLKLKGIESGYNLDTVNNTHCK